MSRHIERIADCVDWTELTLAIVSTLAIFESTHMDGISTAVDTVGQIATLALVGHSLHGRFTTRTAPVDTG